MQHLTSRDNPLVKETIKLKQKKYRQQTGTFLIEGERMLREAFKTPELLVRVFLEDDIPIPREINSLNIECFQVTSAIMKAMADTEHPQGVVAVARIPQHQPEYLFDRSVMVLLLDRIADPGNLGTIIRTGWALDLDGILLTAGCAEPFSPKVVRASMGGICHVPKVTNGGEVCDRLRDKGHKRVPVPPAIIIGIIILFNRLLNFLDIWAQFSFP